ncbi:hypothetical protein LDENG_00063370 [Lucifuga dentata]|nr:hypothetical protein LDENG_00063370 [Lucifuga dentata]
MFIEIVKEGKKHPGATSTFKTSAQEDLTGLNHEFPGETELPPGLRGCHQQADQPGAVRLVCLPVHGESPSKDHKEHTDS